MSKKDRSDHKYEAYKTLTEWVKSVPASIEELEMKGDKDELNRYKKHVKLVLEKLKDIQNELGKK